MISFFAAAAVATTLQMTPCSQLTGLDLPDTRIESAQVVDAGVFEWPGTRPPAVYAGPAEPIPKHCRVKLVLTPTSDSLINAELWLPEQGDWNGRLLSIGNGGWAGSIQGYRDMQAGLRRGYAVVASDNGHSEKDGPFGMFALGHPEKVVDFAFRSIHLMTVRAKQIVIRHYDRPIHFSYYKGCSTGGRQGVMAAQRYPGDFDGIIASALANRHISMHTASVASHIELSRNPEQALDADTAKFVSDSLLEHCDALDLGFVQNPAQCSFDFSRLQCGNSKNKNCLSPAQLQTVKTYYQGVYTEDGQSVFTGQPLGNAIPPQPSTQEPPIPFLFDSVRILGFQNPDYDWRDFDLDRDLPRINAAVGFIDATDPDLRAYKAHGGKLLMYHGWRDPGISANNTVEYYESVIDEMGENQGDWMRLFMVPGMDHCSGGPGPYQFDTLTAMEKWREQGEAPEVLDASNPESGLSQPLCPYPAYAEYNGDGDIKQAKNWQCQQPE